MNVQKITNKLKGLIGSQTSIINSTQSFRKYVEKCQRRKINNEEKIVQPFTISFLKLLNYINQHNLIIEESQKGNKPDFCADNLILECKSTKYSSFDIKSGRNETPKEQLLRYLKSKEFSREYGILFSLDRIETYKLLGDDIIILDDLSFSFVDFYEDKKSNIENFIKTFHISPISLEDKIKIIANTEKTNLIPIESKTFNKILKSLIKDVSVELNTKFVELDDDDDDTRAIKTKICNIKKQMDLKSTSEAQVEYLAQTSYIILARIILTKCWEDLGIIDPPNTYNGGFKKYIEDYNERIREVYERALSKSQDIYYLFNPNNPYLLIKLPEELIVDILFQICKYNFNSLDYDILGYIYEDYLDLEHRKKFGQYYTPPYVVNLILDRVGYKPQLNSLLNYTILDPASGSGTFLLNAVQRIIGSWQDGNNHALEYKKIIENNVFGSELMLFPYLISEINILIQISPVLKEIIKMGKKMNVFHVFPNNSFNLIDKTLISKLADIPEDKIKGDKIMDSAIIKRKERKLHSLQLKKDLDLVVGNPPYVANDTNPELFREMRQYFTFCDETYHNKMDLFYWFIILGILKLKSGGKLCFITTRYWIDKGEKTGVETLKKYILENCYLRELIDLRNVNVFVSATGQENAIFLLEKKGQKDEDEFVNIFRINPRPEKNKCSLKDCLLNRGYCKNDQEYLDCLCQRENEWDGLLDKSNNKLRDHITAFKSARRTSDLKHNRSWDIYSPGEGKIKDIMDKIIYSCKNDIQAIDSFGISYIEKDVIKYIKDFFVLRVGVMTTADEIFILSPELYKEEDNELLIKMESTINIRRSEKQELVDLYEGKIDTEGYVWMRTSQDEKERLLDLYKTPSVYRHGLDISKFVGKLIFFEDEREYNKCPVLVYYLSQFRPIIDEKLKGYKELSPTRPTNGLQLDEVPR